MNLSFIRLNNRLTWGVLYLFLLFFTTPALSAGATILTDRDNNRAEQFSSSLQIALKKSGLQVSLQGIETPLPEPVPADQLWITVGERALTHHILQRPSLPTIALMVTQQQYSSALGEREEIDRITAIFSDPPLERQIRLIRLAIPSARTVGILLSTQPQPHLVERIAHPELEILYQEVTDGVGRVLREIIPRIDVLLTTADPLLYNRNNFRNILLSSYRRRVPMVCHTEASVGAGCIAGSYSTEEELLKQATELIGDVLQKRGEHLPAAEHIRKFSISTNPRVAHSLGLHLKNPDQITRQLLQLEETMP